MALKPWKSGDIKKSPVIYVYVATAVNISTEFFKNCLAGKVNKNKEAKGSVLEEAEGSVPEDDNNKETETR